MLGVVGVAWGQAPWGPVCALPSLVLGPREALGLSETQFPLKEMEARSLPGRDGVRIPGHQALILYKACRGAVSAPSLGKEPSAGCRMPSS